MRVLRYLLVIAAVVGAFMSAARPSSALGEELEPPSCQITAKSPYSTMYPKDDNYRDSFFLDYAVTDNLAANLSVRLLVIVPDGSNTVVRTGPTAAVGNPGTGTVRWSGRDDDGVLVDEGLYAVTVEVTDEDTNVNYDCQVGVTVNHAKLTRTTYRQTIKAADSELDRLVGRCSTLRDPSLRGWNGSLGYYSNKKCTDGFKPSRAATANGLLVPKAFKNRYHSLQIKLYGGAAKARPGSEAALLYLKKDIDADAVLLRWMGSKVGTHAGARTTKTPTFVRRDDNGSPYVAWQLVTVNGLQYDVKNFTVVLEYTGLIDPNDAPRVGALRPRVVTPSLARARL